MFRLRKQFFSSSSFTTCKKFSPLFFLWLLSVSASVMVLPTWCSHVNVKVKLNPNVKPNVNAKVNFNSNLNVNGNVKENVAAVESIMDMDSDSGREKDRDLNSFHCVCDGDCEWLGEGECPWGVTLDFCGCCLLCSRGPGEPCGGAVGTCAQNLVCHKRLGHSEGTCSNRGERKMCETPLIRFGCVFHDGACLCEEHEICPFTEIFLFPNEEACRSRILLLTKSQTEKEEEEEAETKSSSVSDRSPSSSSSSSPSLSPTGASSLSNT